MLMFQKVPNMFFFQGDPRENGWPGISPWSYVPKAAVSESTPGYSKIFRINMLRRFSIVLSVSKVAQPSIPTDTQSDLVS